MSPCVSSIYFSHSQLILRYQQFVLRNLQLLHIVRHGNLQQLISMELVTRSRSIHLLLLFLREYKLVVLIPVQLLAVDVIILRDIKIIVPQLLQHRIHLLVFPILHLVLTEPDLLVKLDTLLLTLSRDPINQLLHHSFQLLVRGLEGPGLRAAIVLHHEGRDETSVHESHC